MGPNDVVVNRWDLNHLLWSTMWLAPGPKHPHELRDLEGCMGRLVDAMLESSHPVVGYATPMNRARVEAMMRWLLDEGHMTPMAVRRLEEIFDDEERIVRSDSPNGYSVGMTDNPDVSINIDESTQETPMPPVENPLADGPETEEPKPEKAPKENRGQERKAEVHERNAERKAARDAEKPAEGDATGEPAAYPPAEPAVEPAEEPAEAIEENDTPEG